MKILKVREMFIRKRHNYVARFWSLYQKHRLARDFPLSCERERVVKDLKFALSKAKKNKCHLFIIWVDMDGSCSLAELI